MVQKEGLTLNAEQAEALRAWYDGLRDVSKTHKLTTRAVRLSEAIAPLMKPWRVERVNGGEWRLFGPNGSIAMNTSAGYRSTVNESLDMHRICDLLNESEARRA